MHAHDFHRSILRGGGGLAEGPIEGGAPPKKGGGGGLFQSMSCFDFSQYIC